nr:DUF2304 family protein [uncultured Pseudodesulfovibrio sp.]
MKLTPLTITLCVIACFIVWSTVNKIIKDRISFGFGSMWAISWLAIGTFTIYPSLLDSLAQLAMMRRIFFVIVAALFLVFGILFKIMSIQDKNKRILCQAIQQQAIQNHRIEHLEKSTELSTDIAPRNSPGAP